MARRQMAPPPPPPPPLAPRTSYASQQRRALVSRAVRWEQRYPLHAAARTGSASVVLRLARGGHDACAADDEGWSAAHYACWCETDGEAAEVLRVLPAAAARTREPHSGGFPLHFALGRGYFAAARALLEAGAEPGERNNEGDTAADVAKELRPPDEGEAAATLLALCARMRPERYCRGPYVVLRVRRSGLPLEPA